MFHVSLVLHRCRCSQYAPVDGRWGRGRVRIGHRIPVSTCVQDMTSFIHRALHQSIEHDIERAVNITNLNVSDKQRWNFITPSWIVASCSKYEDASHNIEPLLCEFGRTGDQSIEFNFTRCLGTRFLAPDSSTPCSTTHHCASHYTSLESLDSTHHVDRTIQDYRRHSAIRPCHEWPLPPWLWFSGAQARRED